MVTDASHDNFVTSETRNSCLKKKASSRNGDIYFLFFCWPHIVLGVLAGFLMDAASIILIVKNVSVHQMKVIVSHIIFFPLTKKCSIGLKEKKTEFLPFWEKQNGFFLPLSAAVSSAAILFLLS